MWIKVTLDVLKCGHHLHILLNHTINHAINAYTIKSTCKIYNEEIIYVGENSFRVC